LSLCQEKCNSILTSKRKQSRSHRTEDPEINPCNYSHLILDKGAKNTHLRMTTFSTNGVGKTGYPHVD
jgi:hypothetical protein